MQEERFDRLVQDRAAFGEYVYTPLAQAVALLRERQSPRLWFRGEQQPQVPNLPDCLRQRSVALLFRHVATPNFEMRRFLRLCERHGLTPVVWELTGDTYTTRNYCKYALGRMGFYAGVGRHGGRRVECIKIIDLDGSNETPLPSVTTLWGEGLIDFHHRILAAELPSLGRSSRFECTSWLAEHAGARSHAYYGTLMRLFVRHAILFETFNLKDEELRFTRDVFLPAHQEVIERFGIKPLVVPSEDEAWEGDDFWQYYPLSVRAHVSREGFHARLPDRLDSKYWVTPGEAETDAAGARTTALEGAMVSGTAPATAAARAAGQPGADADADAAPNKTLAASSGAGAAADAAPGRRRALISSS